ncbi:MAG: HNH endonuclease [Trichodesmium sp.]
MTSMTQVLNQSVVVFSKNYLPMTSVNIKRAIALLITGKAEPLDFEDGSGWSVRSPSMVLYVPEQIRLTMAGQERVWKVPPVNRKEVLKRDHHRCQYCGTTKRLTLDHVIPRSKGGKHSWDNVVTACEKCNATKGNRTPTEAGMKLLNQPKTPIHPTIAFAEQFWRERQHKV